MDESTQPTQPVVVPTDLEPFMGLISLVGTIDALFALDAEPIPDEPFDWSLVDSCHHWFLRQVLVRSDEGSAVLLGVEYRTIARRILARIASHDLSRLHHRRDPARFAAAVVWLAGRGNGQLRRRMPNAQLVWDWFGVTDCAPLGRSLRAKSALEPRLGDPRRLGAHFLCLGDPHLLTSWLRSAIIDRRDALLDAARTASAILCADNGPEIVEAAGVRPVRAGKSFLGGTRRLMVVVEVDFGDDHTHAMALTIPDAHHLVRMVQGALDAPIPRLAPNS